MSKKVKTILTILISLLLVIAIIIGGFFLYALFFSGMMLARRQLEFLFLFVISPVVFATSIGNKQRRSAVIEQLVSLMQLSNEEFDALCSNNEIKTVNGIPKEHIIYAAFKFFGESKSKRRKWCKCSIFVLQTAKPTAFFFVPFSSCVREKKYFKATNGKGNTRMERSGGKTNILDRKRRRYSRKNSSI